jgi:hypothetical protein
VKRTAFALMALAATGPSCRKHVGITAERGSVLSAEGGFLKGQLHLHSNNSGDSQTPPADVIRWYASRGYDFIVFTDHERVTSGSSTSSMLVMPGAELTQNLRTCEPPPPDGMSCLLHVNALFVTPPPGGHIPWPPVEGAARLGRYRRALAATKAMAGIAQLNHPNFDYAADAKLVTELARDGLALLEIANQAFDSNNDPADPRHPSTEAIWDAVLTAGATVFGTATDDAHHYDDAPAAEARGEQVFTGDRGFVMVRSRKDPIAIRDALARGDFYASTGMVLKRLERTAAALELEVSDRSPDPHRFVLIGAGGGVLARAEGRRASFALASARGGYARVVVRNGRGQQAWTQPERVP